MTRSTRQYQAKKAVTLILLLALFTLAKQATANTGAATPVSQGEMQNSAVTGAEPRQHKQSNSLVIRLQQVMPHLDQALIIFTSANSLLIIGGLFLVFLKERLRRQSQQTLATLQSARPIGMRTASSREDDKV